MIKQHNPKLFLIQLKSYWLENSDFMAGLDKRLKEYMRQNPRAAVVSQRQAMAGVFGWKLAAAAAGLVLFFLAAGGGAALATQNSLPGDRLYPAKLKGEEIKMSFVRKPEAKMRAYNSILYERIKELEAVLNAEESGGKYDKKVALALAGLEREFEDMRKQADAIKLQSDQSKFHWAKAELAKSARLINNVIKEDLADSKLGKKLKSTGSLPNILDKIKSFEQ